MDDILGEESENESEGQGKDKAVNEEGDEEEEEQQTAAVHISSRPGPKALGAEGKSQASTSTDGQSAPR